MNATEILTAAAPFAPSARDLVAAIRGGYNLAWGPEEVKALRRSAKIEHMPKHAAEFHALHAILNVSKAMPRGVASDHAEAALACARNRVASMRAAR
jgi:hypothetical protein